MSAFMISVTLLLQMGWRLGKAFQSSENFLATASHRPPQGTRISVLVPRLKWRTRFRKVLLHSLNGKKQARAKCSQIDTILKVARSMGLNMPSGCGIGLCGICKLRKTSGEVHMVHNRGIREEEIAK